MSDKIKILAIIGQSGSGKDSIVKELKKQTKDNVHYTTSFTTRPPREGEIEGVDYHFIKPEEFGKAGSILEVEVYANNWFYGTFREDVDEGKINVGIFDPKRVKKMEKDPAIDLKIVTIIASDKERIMRSLMREEDPNVMEIIRRYQTDKLDFSLLPVSILVSNHDGEFDLACKSIMNIINNWGQN